MFECQRCIQRKKWISYKQIEKVGSKHWKDLKAFSECLKDVKDVYKNIE